ncbi:hypothetical protein ACWEV3_25145 [Saccharopolyspora sp. NPDC003752]
MADEKQVKFDSGQYNNLLKDVDGQEEELNKKFLKASSGVRLASDFGGRVKIGSPSWSAIETFNGKMNSFGESTEKMNNGLSKEWRSFTKALNEAKKVFEDTDDLAQYEASKFTAEYPDLAPKDKS